jgi:hypothetical protein
MRVLGISPSITHLGIAEFDFDAQKFAVRKVRLFELYEYLRSCNEIIDSIRIRVETEHHCNHEINFILAEMCDFLGIEYDLIYCSKDDNIEHFHFVRETGFKGRTNQVMRNAGQLLFEYLKD